MNLGKKHLAYTKSMHLYDRYISGADYEQGAKRLVEMIRAIDPASCSLLDVGCGSGKYLQHLQREFECEGLDLSEGFVEIAKKRCPLLSIHQGDMLNFDLGKQFDAISCLFLAIAYVKTTENLNKAIENMARHLAPGGVLFVEPWVYPDKFWDRRLTAEFIDDPDLKISRMFIARAEKGISVYDIHYLVGTSEGIEYFIEREELGLFTHEQYMAAFEGAGLRPHYDANAGLFEHHNIGMYWGIKKHSDADKL